jgi:hypothetical protein
MAATKSRVRCAPLTALLLLSLGCSGSIDAGGGDPTAPRSPAAAGMASSGRGDGAGASPTTPTSGRGGGAAATPGAPPVDMPGATGPADLPPLPPGGASIDPGRIYSCKPGDDGSIPQRLWRLTAAQYVNSVKTIFAGRRSPTNTNPSLFFSVVSPFNLVAPDRFSNYSYSYTMADAEFRAVLQSAGLVAKNFVGDKKAGCLRNLGGTLSADCLKSAIQDKGPLIFRRPLKDDEVAYYVKLGMDNLASLGAADTVALVFQTMLSSPSFLYRVELGDAGPDASGRMKLGPYELASALAYTLTDWPPDEALWNAAANGQLSTPAQILEQVKRLLGGVGDAKVLVRFMQEYFHYPNVTAVFKDPPPQKGVNHNPGDLVNDTDALVSDVLTNNGQKDFLKTLLTTSVGYINNYSASSYGYPETMVKTRTPTRIMFDPAQRSGIMTQPTFLAGYSSANENKPVQRGRFIRESLLCGSVPSLPIGVIPQLPDLGPNATLRTRQVMHTADPGCAACHHLMDPLGLAFEAYDHYGHYRSTIGGAPVDASGTLTDSGNQDGAFKDAVDLTRKLSASTVVEQCFVRLSFRFFMGQDEREADACSIVAAHDAYAKGGDLVGMLGALFTSKSFLLRVK